MNRKALYGLILLSVSAVILAGLAGCSKDEPAAVDAQPSGASKNAPVAAEGAGGAATEQTRQLGGPKGR